MALIDDSNLTVAQAIALRSSVGEGSTDITGSAIAADQHAYDCLVDVEISGDSVQQAKFTWKGTTSV
jgi:hypothetical protein